MSLIQLPESLLETILGRCETTPLLLLHQSCLTFEHLTRQIFEARLPLLTPKTVHTVSLDNGCIDFEIDSDYVPKPSRGAAITQTGLEGCICYAHQTSTNSKVIIRKINIDDEMDLQLLLSELHVMRHFKGSPHIHQLHNILAPSSCSEWWREVYLVQPYFSCDLGRIIHSQGILSDDHLQYFLHCILLGLDTLHVAGVMHRNLHPQIICSTTNDNHWVSGCSFAHSTHCGRKLDPNVCVRWYRAPELLLGSTDYNSAVDIWSVGCILAELVMRHPLFPGHDEKHQLELIMHYFGTPSDEDMSTIAHLEAAAFVNKHYRQRCFEPAMPAELQQADPLLLDLLARMLVFDPRKRISAKEALRHEWLSSMHDDDDLSGLDEYGLLNVGFGNQADSALKAELWAHMRAHCPGIGPCPR